MSEKVQEEIQELEVENEPKAEKKPFFWENLVVLVIKVCYKVVQWLYNLRKGNKARLTKDEKQLAKDLQDLLSGKVLKVSQKVWQDVANIAERYGLTQDNFIIKLQKMYEESNGQVKIKDILAEVKAERLVIMKEMKRSLIDLFDKRKDEKREAINAALHWITE